MLCMDQVGGDLMAAVVGGRAIIICLMDPAHYTFINSNKYFS